MTTLEHIEQKLDHIIYILEAPEIREKELEAELNRVSEEEKEIADIVSNVIENYIEGDSLDCLVNEYVIHFNHLRNLIEEILTEECFRFKRKRLNEIIKNKLRAHRYKLLQHGSSRCRIDMKQFYSKHIWVKNQRSIAQWERQQRKQKRKS